MENLPPVIRDFVLQTLLTKQQAIFFWLDADGRLGGCGGAIQSFSEAYGVKVGALLSRLTEVLRDFAPHHGDPLFLPMLELFADIHFDTYILSKRPNTWFLVLNTTRKTADLQRQRQIHYEQKIDSTLKTNLIQRYIGDDLARYASMNDEGPVRREMSILFADIREFTKFSNQHSPEETFSVLNTYVASTVEAIMRFGGTIDKVMGDSVMGVFGLEERGDTTSARHRRVLQAACEILKQIAALNQGRPNTQRLDIGIGIASGQTLVGAIGSRY
ncbi:MAG: adenylate/guanylate cyclase domain-containing protein, partial [Nannocystaceae bacterium]